MAMIGDSKVIILDEPTSNLDIISKQKVWDYISNIKNNKAIIVTTQNKEEAELLGDSICII
jgi:ATP-binding cassette subfamily A (ABC1) protein 3